MMELCVSDQTDKWLIKKLKTTKNLQLIKDVSCEIIKRLDMKWISVKDRLPEISEGQFAISVLVAEIDIGYDEYFEKLKQRRSPNADCHPSLF